MGVRRFWRYLVLLASLAIGYRMLQSLTFGIDQIYATPQQELQLAKTDRTQVTTTTVTTTGYPTPSVAYLLLGFEDAFRPDWATDEEDVFIFAPPQRCPSCPAHAQKTNASGAYKDAPEAWWCTQRSYLDALSMLLQQYPSKDYYFLADANTAIFTTALHAMMRYLDNEVLRPTDDLFMGHGMDISRHGPELGFRYFIMSGGGVLVRGLTLRRLAASDTLSECIERVYNGTWCWHHLDWIIAECLAEINVWPQGHPSFQQHTNFCTEYPEPWRCCHEAAVSCHPVEEGEPMRELERRHENYLKVNMHTLSAGWATPCDVEDYEWRWRGWSVVSICNDWAYESLFGKSWNGEKRGKGFPRDFR